MGGPLSQAGQLLAAGTAVPWSLGQPALIS
jgi:hypothetical protein